MNYLYLLLDLGSLSVPFIFSFHPKLKFYKYWKALFLAIPITMLFFIPWDVVFTQKGYWGFNNTYFLNARIASLPIEEWLFFICIPYACVFTHYSLQLFFENAKLTKTTTTFISYTLIAIMTLVLIFNYNKWYPLINYSYAIIIIALVLKYNKELLQKYYLTFLVILVPFFIVNGILTGSFIEDQVVWYNNDENLGIRLLTIPVEDIMYAFTLILTNLALIEYFNTNLFRNKAIE